MILSDVVAIALSVIGVLLSLQGLWLVCLAMWPGRVEMAAVRCRKNGLACFFVGLPATAILLLFAGTVAKRLGGPGQLIGFILLFFYVIFAGVGMSGLVTHIGRRLESPADAGRSWRATVRGGAALELACLIPLLGWVGIFPISLIIGFGAATLTLFSRVAKPGLELPTAAGSLQLPMPGEMGANL